MIFDARLLYVFLDFSFSNRPHGIAKYCGNIRCAAYIIYFTYYIIEYMWLCMCNVYVYCVGVRATYAHIAIYIQYTCICDISLDHIVQVSLTRRWYLVCCWCFYGFMIFRSDVCSFGGTGVPYMCTVASSI